MQNQLKAGIAYTQTIFLFLLSRGQDLLVFNYKSIPFYPGAITGIWKIRVGKWCWVMMGMGRVSSSTSHRKTQSLRLLFSFETARTYLK